MAIDYKVGDHVIVSLASIDSSRFNAGTYMTGKVERIVNGTGALGIRIDKEHMKDGIEPQIAYADPEKNRIMLLSGAEFWYGTNFMKKDVPDW